MKEKKINVGISIGDVNGIGPELIIKTFSDTRMLHMCTPVIFGPVKVLSYYKQVLKIDRFNYFSISSYNQLNKNKLNVLDIGASIDKTEPGIGNPRSGKLAYLSLDISTSYLIESKIDILVTLPINKSTIQSESFNFPGHTEFLTSRFNCNESLMMMVYNDLRIGVVTGHIPLSNVAASITPNLLNSKLKILIDTLRLDFNVQKPKIALLGLNPHSGDDGLLGNEEKEVIIPVIQKFREDGFLIYGPFSADGFFGNRGYKKYDAILAMYHDQGLIPFKTLSEGAGVNYTAGLPFIRTSPDHGVGYDIAGKNKADPTSFRESIFHAIDIYSRRQENKELIKGALHNADVLALTSGLDEIIKEDEVEEL